MAKRMTAKYPGRCKECTGAIHPGDRIVWCGRGEGTYHEDCYDYPPDDGPPERDFPGDPDPEAYQVDLERRQMDADYARGVADAESYMADVSMLGEDWANQNAIERELREGWDY